MNKHSDERRASECQVQVVDSDAVARADAAVGRHSLAARAALFAALGDPTRLTILSALAVEPLCVCDLASLTGVTQSCVSHQLRVLRGLDLVTYRREGKRAVYRLADSHVSTLLQQASDHVAERISVQDTEPPSRQATR